MLIFSLWAAGPSFIIGVGDLGGNRRNARNAISYLVGFRWAVSWEAAGAPGAMEGGGSRPFQTTMRRAENVHVFGGVAIDMV